ncbi:MAG: hypothetical protein LQ352_008376 [Teloschistes flavicans]|nr:MAG: hypothetical protein LQ352_008376 [Teloschistes flavicans]
MPSPFPPSTSAPGRGHVQLTLRPPNEPVFSALSYCYPLKLVVSASHTLPADPSSSSASNPSLSIGHDTAKPIIPPQYPSAVPLLFLLTYGGGLVSGDHISLSLSLAPSTRLTIATQGSTKIFRPATPSSAALTRQDLTAKIAANAALCLMPDPCQPFAESRYAQKQIFEIDMSGSLCMLDWVSEGRGARGEKWAFESWRGRNEIWDVPSCDGVLPPDEEDVTASDGADEGGAQLAQQQQQQQQQPKRRKRLLLRDNLILSNPTLHTRVDGHAIFGTLILTGPLLSPLARFFIDEFNTMPRLGARDFTHPTPTIPQSTLNNPKSTTTTESASTNNESEEASAEQRREQWRTKRHAREKEEGILWTATRVKGGIVVVKFAARSVEAGRLWVRGMVREEGSLERAFGPGALIALK